MKLILASGSPRRAQILRDAGLSFDVVSSDVHETPLDGESPQDFVRRLAQQKARLAAARATGPAVVVGADTVVVADGKMLGKPRSADEAGDILQLLSGRTHTVYTGLTLIRLPDRASRTDLEATQVTFVPMSADEISAYVASGEPLDKAGAYGIQGRGGRYISRIEGCYFNVVGLPLARLCRHLTDLGWKLGHDSAQNDGPMKETASAASSSNMKTCGACGKSFFCGASQRECWCSEIKRTQAAREKLRSQFQDCLCPECLQRAARGSAAL